MTGGLMHLVSNKGGEDIYLTGNPQITFYKIVYRRHTHFAVESIEHLYGADPKVNTTKFSTVLSKSGDLISSMFFELELPVIDENGNEEDPTDIYWVYGVGNAFIKNISIAIGGQIIDTQYGDWMNIWGELATKEGQRNGYDEMVGNSCTPNDYTIGGQRCGLPGSVSHRLYVPIQFWFCRNVGLALPLIALQSSEIKLSFEFRKFDELYVKESGSSGSNVTTGKINAKLYIDYIFLDTEERRRFTNVSHEYLIEQLQWNGGYTVSGDNYTRPIEMQFDHPVKEIVWAHITLAHNTANSGASDVTNGNSWFNYAKSANNYQVYDDDTFVSGRITLNGQERLTRRPASYFRKVQNYEAHTNIPRTPTYNYNDAGIFSNEAAGQYIYTYSFAISPEDHQPSGTCNFSRLDVAHLNLEYRAGDFSGLGSITSYTLNIYAVNYNVLRIMGGQGGIAYSN